MSARVGQRCVLRCLRMLPSSHRAADAPLIESKVGPNANHRRVLEGIV